ncbi:DUF4347 domain-containing protein, partial [Marinobacter sp. SBS5]|uniref:DUF4347 domain-containing protein n=1 Tax=Marinobacter sp. SBS5 TaxID=3401754 RepID=UPI003AAE2D9F
MDRKTKKRTAPVIEALEPRMMFSADMFGGAVDNPAADDSLASLLDDTAAVLEKQTAQLHKEQTDAALAEPSLLEEASPRLELVFVDTDTPDYQQLVDDLLSNSDDSRRFEVILLDNNSDGIAQITAALPGYQGIDAIHLISHGEDGAVDLGNTQLNNQNLSAYQYQLQSWAEHLNADADILFYGCELAASADGQTLIDRIATFTGADIAASDDLTGNAGLGGDWELEYSVGQIDAHVAFSEQVQATWQGSLSPVLWLSTDQDVTSSGANGLDSWTEGQVLEFSGATLAHGEATSGDLSMVLDFDAFTIGTVDTDQPVDTGALHFVSRDITVGGANGTFDLKAGDVLVSFLQEETILAAYSSTGANMLVQEKDLLVFRPSTFNDYSAGTFTVLLDDVDSSDLKGVTLIEQDTTIGGTDIAAGSFLLIASTSVTTSIDLFVPTGVGAGTTTGTTTPLIDISKLGISPDMLRGIEVIEAATTVGGQSLAKGDILATIRNEPASVGSNGLPVTQNDVFVLSLTATGIGTTAGSATMFLDGSDVGVDSSPRTESPYALALYNYSQVIVDTTNDVADGNTSSIKELLLNKGTDGKISLREAILAANNPGNSDVTDIIRFNITDPLVNGAHTIALDSALPTITDTLVIDGTSEPDFSGTPVIRIDGSAAGNNVDGLSFSASSDNSIVRGMMITGFTRDGILVQAGADHLTFTGNWIGTSGAGSTGVGNGDDGIELIGSYATIGGTGANEGNVITNAGDEGINIAGTGVTAHLIQGNYIGLDPDGVSGSGNTDVGIAIISGSGNTIGGTTASARNVISNNFEGIEVNTSNNIFQGNYIGTDASGTLDRGNRSDDGIEIQSSATGNLIGGTETGAGNLIAFNALDGVNIVNGNGNTVLGNQIHSNSGLGIDLGTSGVTSNDSGDGDSGANDLQNYPIVTTADLTGTNLTLSGTLDTNGVSAGYRVEFFGNTAGTQDATNGEGRFYLGSTQVTTDVNGDASFTDVTLGGVTLSEGDYVTATATRIDDAGQMGSDDQLAYGDTSEFAANVVIANGNNAPELTGANDLNPINEDDSNNSGTLVSELIAGQVSDADSGSSAGIAVVGVDNTNGTWEYTTNGGGVWTAFGSPSTSAARLLAADVNTLVRFVPDANWNGTVANGITFHAWDQTNGANGESMAIEESPWVVRDEFSSVSYSNSDGTNVWSTDWVEVDGSGVKPNPAEDGRISVSGNELKIQVASAGNNIYREVNLENATSATLSFSYDNGLGSSAKLFAQVSKDGGATYDTLVTFDASTNQGVGTQTLDISAYIASNTQVRFYVSDGVTGAGNNKLSIDNVQIEYVELGGGSSSFSSTTASANVAVNAMADTPSVTDASTNEDIQSTSGLVILPNPADGSEVTHYKVSGITNGALYKNDGITQINNGDFITVAEGSAGLKFTPAADFSGSGNFTIQASTSSSDAGLGGDTAVATITVAPVNDVPTASNNTVTTNEDVDYVFSATDFNFADADSGDTLQQVRISSLPVSGTLQLSGVDVALNQIIEIADINAGNLVFVPSANENGSSYAIFNFEVSDGVPFGATGTELGSFPATGVVNSMSGLAFDGNGLWLTSPNNDTIYNYDTAGNLVTSFAAPGTSPTGITFDGTNLWVISRDANMVYEIDTLGNVQSSFATPGTDSRGLTWDGSNLWLVEGNGSLIYKLNTAGAVQSSVAWPDDYLRDITWDGSSLWVADSNGQQIIQIDTNGSELSRFASPGTGATGLTFDGVEFWHADADTDTVYQLAGPNSVGFSSPATMTIDVIAVNDAPIAQDDRVGLSFDGVDDYVVVPHSASLEMTNNLTMEVWINHDGAGTGTQIIVGKEGEYEIGITADTGEIKWAIADTTPTWGWVETGYFVEPGEWAHIAVTYDGISGEIITYVNGVQVGDAFSRPPGEIGDVYATFDELRIGGRENATDQRFSGLIDEVRIWDTTRTETEIQQNMDGLLVGDEAGLVGNWRFDEGVGTTVSDRSTFGNHGTLGGVDAPASVPVWSGYITTEDAVLDTAAAAINGVLANDINVDSNPLTATNLDTTGTLGLVTLNPDGSFTYDPNGKFDYLSDGESAIDTFSYTANDGTVDSNPATVTITVIGSNNAPLALDDAYAVGEDSYVSGNVITDDTGLGADSDPEGHSLQVSLVNGGAFTAGTPVTLASGAEVTFQPDGLFTYSTNGQFQHLGAGQAATDKFTYQVSDGNGGFDTAEVTITVNGTNDAATITVTATDTAVTEDDGSNSSATGTVSISDPDTGEGTLASSTANFGMVTVDGSGNWTYALNNGAPAVQALAAGDTLTDTITFTSDDGTTQTQDITITGANDAATISVTVADTSVTEDDAGNNTANGTVTVTDPDAGQGTLASSTATYGTVAVDGSGNWTYAL